MVVEIDRQAANQLRTELQDSIIRSRDVRRPVLTHLNADTTWLLSIAYPDWNPPPAGRLRFNILIDPWLQGPQSDVASWFSTQWHAIKSSVNSIDELNEILAQSEANGAGAAASIRSFVDAVVVSHEFTDHCHESTLRELHPSVPVFATTKAVELIRSWNHFTTVLDMAAFSNGTDWRDTSTSPLPAWIGISKLVTEADSLYYHSAIVICIQSPDQGEQAECVIYTPHGVEAATFTTLSTVKPTVTTLALLHGLHDVSLLTKQLNLGAHNALQAHRLLNPRYWVGTHDEVKKGGGLIAPFLRRKSYTLVDALTRETRMNKQDRVGAKLMAEVSHTTLASGQSLLLV